MHTRYSPRTTLFFGLTLTIAVTAAAGYVANMPWAKANGFSMLTLAMVGGILLGNSLLRHHMSLFGNGLDLARGRLLRLGIVLFGMRVTLDQIGAVGWSGLLIAALVVTLTFLLAVWLGIHVLKIDRELAMLIGAGSAICGAAAVIATEPVLRSNAHKSAVAVATVVVFGTIAMFLYPALYGWLGLEEHFYGLYAGSTIHEVAQVVVAGGSVGKHAGEIAVIEKMLRVMLLAPFLLILGAALHWLARRGQSTDNNAAGKTPLTIPWFAFGFIALALLHSFVSIPAEIVAALVWLDDVLLTMAMAALGIYTQARAIREAGAKPLALAGILFVFLILGGYVINKLLL